MDCDDIQHGRQINDIDISKTFSVFFQIHFRQNFTLLNISLTKHLKGYRHLINMKIIIIIPMHYSGIRMLYV